MNIHVRIVTNLKNWNPVFFSSSDDHADELPFEFL